MKFFNTEGPIRPDKHYFIPHRLNWDEILDLIQREKYFVLHAPRQSGKTTEIQELTLRLNATGKYHAVYVNVENAQAARNQVEKALISIIETLKHAIEEYLGDEEKALGYFDDLITQKVPVTLNSLKLALSFWAKHSQKPVILFIDEIDSLMGDSLLSVLRQIRSGYIERPVSFPQSICLIGSRDVKDYKIWPDSNPFNIKAKSFLLPNFSLEEVAELYGQHTKETGQIFDQEAIEYAFHLTAGQPWLVNALGFEATLTEQTPITKEVIERAKDTLIKRRDTHLDFLIDKLRESHVFPIIDAIIKGANIINFDSDSVQYVRDLGLIKQDRMEIASPIYQEISNPHTY